MSKSKEDVARIVDNEGLGYAITSYMSGDDIDDDELRELWHEAYEVLTRIEELLEDYYE